MTRSSVARSDWFPSWPPRVAADCRDGSAERSSRRRGRSRSCRGQCRFATSDSSDCLRSRRNDPWRVFGAKSARIAPGRGAGAGSDPRPGDDCARARGVGRVRIGPRWIHGRCEGVRLAEKEAGGVGLRPVLRRVERGWRGLGCKHAGLGGQGCTPNCPCSLTMESAEGAAHAARTA